jgi:hypothetical protein
VEQAFGRVLEAKRLTTSTGIQSASTWHVDTSLPRWTQNEVAFLRNDGYTCEILAVFQKYFAKRK